MSFDPQEYIKQQNEKEAANRVGTPKQAEPAKPAEAAVAVAEPEDPEEKKEQEHMRLPRSARRELNRLREELGRTKGMLEAFEKMGKTPAGEEKPAEPKIDPEAKPDRANFATDAEFTEALGAWSGRQEVAKSEQQRQWQQRIQDMAEKAAEDAKIIPDWDEHAKAASTDGPEFTPAEHPTLMALIAASEYQALAMDYFATHPDEFEEMLSLTAKKDKNGYCVDQVAEFRALEGHLKRVYKGLKAKAAEPAKEVAKEPEPKPAKLPKPSESAATRGGSAPATEVSPYLADGKTLNPLWKEQRNIREGARR